MSTQKPKSRPLSFVLLIDLSPFRCVLTFDDGLTGKDDYELTFPFLFCGFLLLPLAEPAHCYSSPSHACASFFPLFIHVVVRLLSCGSHFAESVFSESSEISTCVSSVDDTSVDFHRVQSAIRSQTVRLPLRLPLPPPGLRTVDFDALTHG